MCSAMVLCEHYYLLPVGILAALCGIFFSCFAGVQMLGFNNLGVAM